MDELRIRKSPCMSAMRVVLMNASMQAKGHYAPQQTQAIQAATDCRSANNCLLVLNVSFYAPVCTYSLAACSFAFASSLATAGKFDWVCQCFDALGGGEPPILMQPFLAAAFFDVVRATLSSQDPASHTHVHTYTTHTYTKPVTNNMRQPASLCVSLHLLDCACVCACCMGFSLHA